MPGKRFSVEQIVAKLREAEKLQGQGARPSSPSSTALNRSPFSCTLTGGSAFSTASTSSKHRSRSLLPRAPRFPGRAKPRKGRLGNA